MDLDLDKNDDSELYDWLLSLNISMRQGTGLYGLFLASRRLNHRPALALALFSLLLITPASAQLVRIDNRRAWRCLSGLCLLAFGLGAWLGTRFDNLMMALPGATPHYRKS